MSSITLPFSSSRAKTLAELPVGTRAMIVEVSRSSVGRADRLLSLGVTPGASVSVLQTFPGVIFLCDQTELAIERSVARSIGVRVHEPSAAAPATDVEESR